MMMGNVTVNVMETDAVFWWATIFCISRPLLTLQLSASVSWRLRCVFV